MASERGLRVGVCVGTGLLALLVTASVVADAVGGLDATTIIQSFQASNLMLGVPAGICGVVLAWHRPRHRLGWVLLGAGLATGINAVSAPLIAIGFDRGWPTNIMRSLSTIYPAWTACQFLFLPLAVLLFPDDRTPGPRWRWVPVVVGVAFVVQVFRFSAGANGIDTATAYADKRAPSYLAAAWWNSTPGAVLAGSLELGVYALLLVTMVVRYRRGNEQTRRQILWLLWALMLALALIGVDLTVVGVGASAAILVLGLIGLVPVAMTFALLRHDLLDIRLVWSRTLAYLLLTAAALVAYIGLVDAGEELLRGAVPATVPAALLVAIAFHPVRIRLQRMIDAGLYGDRGDPVRTAAALTSELAGRATTPGDLMTPLRLAMRLPYAELRELDGAVASSGEPVPNVERVTLAHGGVVLGELVVGVRRGQGRLDPADRSLLALIAAPLGLAMHATALARSVKGAADDIAASRRDERRRLRNDLHDGVGPLLTGIAFHAEALGNLLAEGPGEAQPLVKRLRESAAEAMIEVRTLIDQLRPTSLEQRGLIDAIDDHASGLARRPDGSMIQCVVEGRELPPLPAQVETALFRVAVEAVTNAVRHTAAERVDVELWAEDAHVMLSVLDDGGSLASWSPGVGIGSMRDRVCALGGRIAVGPGRIGGEVRVSIPLPTEEVLR